MEFWGCAWDLLTIPFQEAPNSHLPSQKIQGLQGSYKWDVEWVVKLGIPLLRHK